MSTKPLKVALYGAGSMGSYHARVISSNHKVVLSYVVDTSLEKAEQLAKVHNAIGSTDTDSLLDVSAVVIATPTEFHFETAFRYISAGVPVLVEKPISLSMLEIETLIEAALISKVTFKCGLVERFNPVVIKAMEIVESPIHFSSIRHSPYVPRIQTPVTGDLLIHDLDFCMRLYSKFGEMKRIESIKTINEKSLNTSSHMVNVLISFPEDRTGVLSASRLDHQKKRKIQILENDRSIELDLLYKTISIYRGISNSTLLAGLSDQIQTVIEVPTLQSAIEPLAAQFEYFIHAVIDFDQKNESVDLQSYLDVHRQISYIDKGDQNANKPE